LSEKSTPLDRSNPTLTSGSTGANLALRLQEFTCFRPAPAYRTAANWTSRTEGSHLKRANIRRRYIRGTGFRANRPERFPTGTPFDPRLFLTAERERRFATGDFPSALPKGMIITKRPTTMFLSMSHLICMKETPETDVSEEARPSSPQP
jgi:hypothetical protein